MKLIHKNSSKEPSETLSATLFVDYHVRVTHKTRNRGLAVKYVVNTRG